MCLHSQVLEDYVVYNRTMALIPVFEGKAKTKILEFNGTILTTKLSPLQIIKKACLDRGSSLQGRYDAVKQRLNIRQRMPIPIDQREGIYAFPIMSAKKPENIWVFYDHVDRVACNTERKGSTIYFYDGQCITTEVSDYLIAQQILKSGRCKTVFQETYRSLFI